MKTYIKPKQRTDGSYTHDVVIEQTGQPEITFYSLDENAAFELTGALGPHAINGYQVNLEQYDVLVRFVEHVSHIAPHYWRKRALDVLKKVGGHDLEFIYTGSELEREPGEKEVGQ